MDRKQTSYQEALCTMVAEMHPTHWITCHWHRGRVGPEQVQADLRKLARKVDIVLLGKQCHRKSYATRRTEAIYFVERSSISTHVHGFWTISPTTTTAKRDKVEQTIARMWRSIVAASTVCLREYDADRAAVIYSVKEQTGEDASDRVIVSRQWLPAAQQEVLAAQK